MYPRIDFSGTRGGAGAAPDADSVFSTIVDGSFFADIDHDTAFYILRHGQSEGNATMTFQGRLDYPLDATGVAQATAAAAWFSDKSIDVVVSSPMKRAAATASLVAAACGLPEPLLLQPLVEVDVGLFSGVDMETARARHPEIFGRFQNTSWDAVPDAENSVAMYARAVESWTAMRELALKGARNIVCVSHGGLIQWLIRCTFGARSWLPLIPAANCGISRYDVETIGPGKPAFVQWGLISYKVPSTGETAKPVF